MSSRLRVSAQRSSEISASAVARAVQASASLGLRDCASGALLKTLSQVLDSHPEASNRYVDVGEQRAITRPGTRISSIAPSRIFRLRQSAEVMGRALCALDSRPRAYVVSCATLIAFRDYPNAEKATQLGMDLFGVESEGGALALSGAMVARRRGDWVEAKRLYLAMHDCRVDSYRRVAFAAAALAAVESEDLPAAGHFYLALVSMGMCDGHTELRRVAAIRSRRGEQVLVTDLCRRLAQLVGSRIFITSHA